MIIFHLHRFLQHESLPASCFTCRPLDFHNGCLPRGMFFLVLKVFGCRISSDSQMIQREHIVWHLEDVQPLLEVEVLVRHYQEMLA